MTPVTRHNSSSSTIQTATAPLTTSIAPPSIIPTIALRTISKGEEPTQARNLAHRLKRADAISVSEEDSEDLEAEAQGYVWVQKNDSKDDAFLLAQISKDPDFFFSLGVKQSDVAFVAQVVRAVPSLYNALPNELRENDEISMAAALGFSDQVTIVHPSTHSAAGILPQQTISTASVEAEAISQLKADLNFFFELEEALRSNVSFLRKAIREVPTLYLILEPSLQENEELIVEVFCSDSSLLPESLQGNLQHFWKLLIQNPSYADSLSRVMPAKKPPSHLWDSSEHTIVHFSIEFFNWYLAVSHEGIPKEIDRSREPIIKAFSELDVTSIRKSLDYFMLEFPDVFAHKPSYMFRPLNDLLQLMDIPEVKESLKKNHSLSEEQLKDLLAPIKREAAKLDRLSKLTGYSAFDLFRLIHEQATPDQVFGESLALQMRRRAASEFAKRHEGKPSGNILLNSFISIHYAG